jgi:hypothetical protein
MSLALAPWADSALQAAGPRLAYELAANLRPHSEILSGFGLSQEQFDQVVRSPWFVSMLDEARAKWATEMGALERVRLKSMVALEDSMSIPYLIAHDPEQPGSTRLEAMKTMERLAGVVPVAPSGAGAGEAGPKFSIVIDLGEGKSVTASYDPGAQGVGGQAPTLELDEGGEPTPVVSERVEREAGIDGSLFGGD